MLAFRRLCIVTRGNNPYRVSLSLVGGAHEGLGLSAVSARCKNRRRNRKAVLRDYGFEA
jgi:hypothetical protein